MAPHKQPWQLKLLALFVFLPLLLLSACGSSGGGGGTTTGTTSNKGTITVGGKKDVEAQLLTEMYTQLLRRAG
jgi:osmoprotectant transport system substrate-binding protein